MISLSAMGELYIKKIVQKLGSNRHEFCDERILKILEREDFHSEIFVDVPLTFPPCGECTRPVCPGVPKCEDIAVSYIHSVSHKKISDSKTKLRPLSPQSMRLTDIFLQENHRVTEASFGTNLFPLVVRGKAFVKLMKQLNSQISVLETSIPVFLEKLFLNKILAKNESKNYRSFERGLEHRKRIVTQLIAFFGWKMTIVSQNIVSANIEIFHAWLCAVNALLKSQKKLIEPPQTFPIDQGWVYLPEKGA